MQSVQKQNRTSRVGLGKKKKEYGEDFFSAKLSADNRADVTVRPAVTDVVRSTALGLALTWESLD